MPRWAQRAAAAPPCVVDDEELQSSVSASINCTDPRFERPSSSGEDDGATDGFWDDSEDLLLQRDSHVECDADKGKAAQAGAKEACPLEDQTCRPSQLRVSSLVQSLDSHDVTLNNDSCSVRENLSGSITDDDLGTEGHEGCVDEELLEEEFELLSAVFTDGSELNIQRQFSSRVHSKVTVQLSPLTAGENQMCFVCAELVLEVLPGYPQRPTRPVLGRTKGMSDEQLNKLTEHLREHAKALAGECALYALVEAAQEALTEANVPTGDCMICLKALVSTTTGQHDLIRAPCFHCFHSGCLGNYWWSEWTCQHLPHESGMASVARTVVKCPMCREVLHWADVPQLASVLQPFLDDVQQSAAPMSPKMEKNVSEHDELVQEAATAAAPEEVVCGDTQVDEESVTVFEVVHHCGTCFRSKPRWNAKVGDGRVGKGYSGIVAEFKEGDTTYIRPEGSKYYLPVKGLSASVKLIHMETVKKSAEVPPAAGRSAHHAQGFRKS
eukprot:TRINITY_DN38314_c0_g1_i3.p1 TRINITY_DN38314_c0_g1~~TRINITY_DN38314_c0_g1_i3.p1  ORF type:complete len:497 (-),score=67.25 TRINITY_DN38314_c0_g1_i3:774-2264(-)